MSAKLASVLQLNPGDFVGETGVFMAAPQREGHRLVVRKAQPVRLARSVHRRQRELGGAVAGPESRDRHLGFDVIRAEAAGLLG